MRLKVFPAARIVSLFLRSASVLIFLLCAGSSLSTVTSAAVGDVLWTYQSTNQIHQNGELKPAIAPDGAIYFPNGRYVDALTTSGNLKWSAGLPLADQNEYGPAIRTPTVLRDGTILATPGENWGTSNLFALNPANGNVIWARPWTPLSIAAGLHGVFIVDTTNLHSLDTNGDAKWSAPFTADFPVVPSVSVGPEGNVYVAATALYAFNQSGELLWTNPSLAGSDPTPNIHLSGIIDDGRIVAAGSLPLTALVNSRGERLAILSRFFPYAILPNDNLVGMRDPIPAPEPNCCGISAMTPDGQVLWDYKASWNFPFVVDAQGTIYAIVNDSEGQSLIALTFAGALKSKTTLPDPFGAYTSLTMAWDGTLYVGQRIQTNGGWRGALLALKGENPVSTRNWPLLGRDPANSRSQEKLFSGVNLAPLLSRTSVVLRAEVKSDVSASAILLFGDTPERMSPANVGSVSNSPSQQLAFSFTDLQPMRRYYYQFVLSNRTTVAKLPRETFETPGANTNVELTSEALRFAVLGGGTITFRTNGTLYLTNEIKIAADTVLDAAGLDLTIDGTGMTRLFSIENASVTFRGLKFLNGRSQGAPGSLECSFGTNGAPGLGGAIAATNSQLIIESCLFSNNVAQGGQGVFSLGCTKSVPSGDGAGGAIFSLGGSLVVSTSRFVRCFANGGDGGFAMIGPISPGQSDGGAIATRNCNVQITQSVFERNSLQYNANRFQVTTPAGGAIFLSNSPALISSSQFRSNSASWGGAIASDSSLVLADSSFDRNSAVAPSHRILGVPGRGGAIFASSTNDVVIERSTFTRNEVYGGTYGEVVIFFGTDAEGGALYCFPGRLSTTNCVFALNTAQGRQAPAISRGGAIFCSEASIDWSTIASNRAEVFSADATTNYGAAGVFTTNGTVTLHATILSNSRTNIEGAVLDAGYNLSSDETAFTNPTSRSSIDPHLDRFIIPAGYRGYFLLPSNSPAIDAGDPKNFPDRDVLGVSRPFGTRPDIGALESVPLPSIFLAVTANTISFSIRTGLRHSSVIEASNDLQTWTPVYSAPASSEYQYQPDRNDRYGFYRVREATE